MALQECFSISSNTCRKGTCANLHGIGKLLAYIIDYKYRYKILQIHISYIVYWYINIYIYIQCISYIHISYIYSIYIYLYTYIISNIILYITVCNTEIDIMWGLHLHNFHNYLNTFIFLPLMIWSLCKVVGTEQLWHWTIKTSWGYLTF